MRAWLVVLVILIPIGAAETELSFSPPAQWQGDVGLNVTWLVVVFDGPSDGRLEISSPLADATNHTVRYAAADAAGLTTVGGTLPGPPSQSEGSGSLDAAVTFPAAGRASLVITADRIHVQAAEQRGVLRGLGPDGRPYDAVQEPRRATSLVRADHDWGGHVAATGDPGGGPLNIEAHGVRSVEWMNASVTCDAWCPSGGGLWGVREDAAQSRALAYQISFTQITAGEGSLSGSLHARAWAGGGPMMDASVDGWLRLPLAESLCQCLAQMDGRSVQANGTLYLSDLHATDDRLETTLSGDTTWLRADEEMIDASMLGWKPQADVAAAAAVFALPFLLWALRASHNRRRIEAVIIEHPGITFRGIMRTLDLSNGTVAHHTRKLLKSGAVVRFEAGRAHHFFENHGRYGEAECQALAGLQDPSHRLLVATLLATGDIRQKDALLLAQRSLGWGASTTQRRLKQLVNAGVLHSWTEGGRWYRTPESVSGKVDLLDVLQGTDRHDGQTSDG